MANRRAEPDLGRALTSAERKARGCRLADERGGATAEAIDATLVRVVFGACRELGGGGITVAELVRRVLAAFPEAERKRVLARLSPIAD